MISKKNVYLFILIFFNCASILGQTNKEQAKKVLLQTLNKLTSLKKVSYNFERETRYFEDNYSNNTKCKLYLEKEDKNVIGYKFIGTRAESGNKYIYNGTDVIELDKVKNTIKMEKVEKKTHFNSNSFLLHSYFMLMKLIPNLLSRDSLITTLYDTVINKKNYYNVVLEGQQLYFGTVNGSITPFDKKRDLRKPYYLIIDIKTFLPFKFVSRNITPTNDRDYLTITFLNVNTNPKTETNAFVADSYGTYEAPKPEIKIPVIKKGTEYPLYNLPMYLPNKKESLTNNSMLGKVVLYDFWFKSCGPCMESMPHLNELVDKYKDFKFELISINVEDPIEDIKFFYNKLKPKFKMLYSGQSFYNNQLGLSACPTAILVNNEGIIIEIFIGFNKEKMEKKIEELLKD